MKFDFIGGWLRRRGTVTPFEMFRPVSTVLSMSARLEYSRDGISCRLYVRMATGSLNGQNWCWKEGLARHDICYLLR